MDVRQFEIAADVAATPAERGLTKTCNGCGRRLPVEQFYVKTRGKMTADGRRYRMSRCAACHNARLSPTRDGKRARHRARQRAHARLAQMVPELFEGIYREELAKEGVT